MLTQQVIQGDCKEVLRSMPNESVDFVLTDPPYIVRYRGRDVAVVPYFVAFAYWKVAIIAEGVHRRWLSNPANGAESAARVGDTVPLLIANAEEAAGVAGI